jgi:hypothetical protein
VAVALGLTCLVALVATSRDYGMVWDEGHSIRREKLLEKWFAWVVEPPQNRTRTDAFSKRNLALYWPFSREEPDGHPPFYALLGLAGWAVSGSLVHPLTAYRFGPMFLCAVTTGAVFLHVRRNHGWLAAVTSAGAIVLMPRSFSAAHYAHYDMPMSCLWVLAQISFLSSLQKRCYIVPFGVLFGLAAGTKFTGLFAAAPAVAWAALVEWLPALRHRPRRDRLRSGFAATRVLIQALPLAALTLVLIQPPWWANPIEGAARFLHSNLTRYETKPIPVLYFGQVYEFSLPWHNTIVLTAITVPLLMLILGMVGITAIVFERKRTAQGLLWLLSWGVLMVVRAMPGAPGHDGIRLFLPSFLSFAVLIGVGVGWLVRLVEPRKLAWCVTVMAFSVLGEGLLGIARLYPYTLSYYNGLVGHLPGAERQGFELTYYWDTLGPDFFRWVREQSRLGELELGFPIPLYNMRFLLEWGDLPPEVRLSGFGPATHQPYYVLQRRQGLYFPCDHWIERHGHPVFTVAREGVDLLRIYAYHDALAADLAGKDMPVPDYLRRAQALHSRLPEPEKRRDPNAAVRLGLRAFSP